MSDNEPEIQYAAELANQDGSDQPGEGEPGADQPGENPPGPKPPKKNKGKIKVEEPTENLTAFEYNARAA